MTRLHLPLAGFLITIAIAAILLSAAAAPDTASAQSSKECWNRFGGNAFVDGRKASDGTLIEALSAGIVVGTATVITASDSINYVLDAARPPVGVALTFRVGGIVAVQTASWQSGTVTYPFDLHASRGGGISHSPHTFSGVATLNGQPVTEVVEIAAVIEGRTVAITCADPDGQYEIRVQQSAPDAGVRRVTFTVDGQVAEQSAVWRTGGDDQLSLSARGPRPTAEVFAPLIRDGSLVALWWHDSANMLWRVFDPRPGAAAVNALAEVGPGYVVWVRMSRPHSFQGNQLYAGWNIIALR